MQQNISEKNKLTFFFTFYFLFRYGYEKKILFCHVANKIEVHVHCEFFFG